MFRIFSRWCRAGRRKHSRVVAAPLEPELSDVEILHAHCSPAPHDLSALTDLVRLITKPLDAATRERLVTHVCDAELGEDVSSILHWVLTRDVAGPETTDPSEWCLCICVDWRASDEVEWQANRLLATLRIEDRWISPVGELTAKRFPRLRRMAGSKRLCTFTTRHRVR